MAVPAKAKVRCAILLGQRRCSGPVQRAALPAPSCIELHFAYVWPFTFNLRTLYILRQCLGSLAAKSVAERLNCLTEQAPISTRSGRKLRALQRSHDKLAVSAASLLLLQADLEEEQLHLVRLAVRYLTHVQVAR